MTNRIINAVLNFIVFLIISCFGIFIITKEYAGLIDVIVLLIFLGVLYESIYTVMFRGLE